MVKLFKTEKLAVKLVMLSSVAIFSIILLRSIYAQTAVDYESCFAVLKDEIKERNLDDTFFNSSSDLEILLTQINAKPEFDYMSKIMFYTYGEQTNYQYDDSEFIQTRGLLKDKSITFYVDKENKVFECIFTKITPYNDYSYADIDTRQASNIRNPKNFDYATTNKTSNNTSFLVVYQSFDTFDREGNKFFKNEKVNAVPESKKDIFAHFEQVMQNIKETGQTDKPTEKINLLYPVIIIAVMFIATILIFFLVIKKK